METQKSVAVTEPASAPQPADGESTVVAVLFALSLSHLLNDVMQSLIPAVYPLLKSKYDLTVTQIGLITFTFQITASLLQPLVGIATDRRPRPYSLVTGMVFTLAGLVVLGFAATFPLILIGSALVGIGSSVFHPEASRVARLASGGKHGFAQSLFQVARSWGCSPSRWRCRTPTSSGPAS
jgi:FSR family fosmidomycin resistance protein-like MFS transporter